MANLKKLMWLLDDLGNVHQGEVIVQYGLEVRSLEGVNATLHHLKDSEMVQDFLQLHALLHLVSRVDE